MTELNALSITHGPSDQLRRKIIAVLPAAAAMVYPWVLSAFHAVVSPPDGFMSAGRIVGAAVLLALAFALPLSGLASAYWWTFAGQPSEADMRARRLAYASIGAPPLYVFVGVVRGYIVNLLGLQVADVTIWIVLWIAAALYAWFGGDQPVTERKTQSSPALRVVHGVAAALITCYVLFHLTNHLFGLAGPETHAEIMKAGRTVYRSPYVEPVFILLLLFQGWSGVRLAWHWSSLRTDGYRVFQIASGAYLAAYLLAHVNSGLIAARNVYHIETNWAWAAGAPQGLIHSAWSIRLLPHYALGVFFILSHLAAGLRVVMIAHDVRVATANRVLWIGMAVAALISATIIFALCGLRI